MRITRKLKLFISQSAEICDKVKKNDNKSKVRTFFDIVGCSIKYKSSPHNYDVLGFSQLNKEQRKTFLTFSDSLKMMDKYNSKKHEAIFYNKFIFSKVFSEFYGRKCVLTNYLSKEEFEQFISSEEKIIYKPVNGGKGCNIEVMTVADYASLDEMYNHVMALPFGILESWINQHHLISGLYPNAVNPLRIITLFDGKKCHFLGATLSVGKNAEYANSSVNASFVLVDIDTGTLLTDASDFDGTVYHAHPQTNTVFKGFAIPYWQETLDMLEKAVRLVPQVGFVGWDIAITEEGPIIIEGNNDPGYTAYQLPLFTGGCGIRKLYEPFLSD